MALKYSTSIVQPVYKLIFLRPESGIFCLRNIVGALDPHLDAAIRAGISHLLDHGS